ncbi:MAG: hypothetical protein B7Y83_00140 [Flavobacteriales bacterium 32-34-25]|nr:MAG: hypothetical protein B7Y83_00140 [Flavobacteriales bacterium 32-34-25]
MDYFNGKTDDDFIKFFIDELYSKTEFVQVTPPVEEFEPDQEYGKHILATQQKLHDYIKAAMREKMNYMSVDSERKRIEKKKKALFEKLLPDIELYISKIKIDYK